MRTQNNVLPDDVLIPHFGKDAVLTGIEIGTFEASGTLGMLSRMPNLFLYTVDPWKHIEGAFYEASLPQDKYDEIYTVAVNRLSNYKNRVAIIKKSSDEAINDVPSAVDFVYIDGHHEYNQVLRDIQNYMPKVRSGGILAGHDYIQVPDVLRAVNDTLPAIKIRQAEDFIWWLVI